jgi:putative endonuclease
MPCLNKSVGKYGEDLAKIYLKNIGYTIIDVNYRCKLGEIDIIAKDKDFLCFIEVKTRYNNFYGTPAEAVNFSKQKTIYKVAQTYICHKKVKNIYFRFDVLEVITNKQNDSYHINLIKDAFQINL